MLAITSRLKERIFGALRPRLLAISLALAAAVLLLLNTLPNIALERAEKQEASAALSAHAEYLAARMTKLPALTPERVAAQMSGYPTDGTVRVLVLDPEARVQFDSSVYDNLQGRIYLVSGVEAALSGHTAAQTESGKSGMESWAIVPLRGKQVAGAVYVWRKSVGVTNAHAALQQMLFWLSVLLAGGVICTMLCVATDLTGRLRKMIAGVRRVQNGAYGEQIPCEGQDELTVIASEFNKLSRQIRETDELRRTFVSDASHELRTPLSSIRLLTDSILQTEGIDVATTREFLADIGEEIDRLTRIAERLLILTRLDGAKQLVLEPVDLKKVAESVITTLLPTAEEAEVTLKQNLADDCVFDGNADGAYQVLFNLIENAIKYNRPGGTVHVLLFAKDGQCHIIVDDDGIGIPKEDYGHIFERFYRVDKARSRSGKGGTGLGLAIVAKTVENYHGTISVEPSAMGGTRFTVTFPQSGGEVAQ